MSIAEEYNKSTFFSRFQKYLSITDPRTLIYSDEQVLNAQKLISQNPNLSAEDLTLNKNIVEAAIHPVSGEIIPKLFRVSAIAPVNIPLVFAMITCPASNIPGTLFLHFLNQSYNAACNYANRSGSDQSIQQLLKAYGLAVTSACTLAYGMGKVVEKGPPLLKRFGILIPCLATAAANVSNIVFTRMNEITDGVPVIDENGKTQGISSKAGFLGVQQSALTRCVLVPCAVLLIPPAIMGGLGVMKLVPKNKTGRLLVELAVIYVSLQAALPAALAVYPQTAKIPVSDLETKFQKLLDENNKPYEYLYANKGL